MKKLTEEMVIARTKISDMSKIKRLNCWGSELADVSLLRRMPNVEVLSLSINKINGLSDFEHCRKLEELYVRQNEIRELNQVCYLQNLTNLKHLWLGENPCATGDGYRAAVIRALPQLQKLDNVLIQPDELSESLKKGRVLQHPEEHQETDEYEQQSGGYRNVPEYTDQYYQSPERSPPRQEAGYEPEDPGDYYEDEERREYESPPRQSPPRRQPERRRSYSPDPEPAPVYYEDRRNANSYDQDSPRHQQQYFDEYTNGDRPYHQSQYRQHESSDGSNHSHSGAYDAPTRRDRCEKNSCPVNHRPPFNRRPVTRNSNILSAVLCLVKELDYPSLEVVEMAVRCRMDELEE
ncbi:uncharacterized protein CBL_08000 [Carabus blaptoides fortunei]